MSVFPDRYFDAYVEMLAAVGEWPGRPIKPDLCAFWPMRGQRYEEGRDILLAGRAVNGWEESEDDRFQKSDLTAKDVRVEVAERARRLSEVRMDMSWPMQPDENYNPNTSQFWMAARDVFRGHFGDSGDPWSERLSWSNVSKLAPAEGGNPSTALWRAQLDGCRGLLRMEVEILEPALALFFTGWDWAADMVPNAIEWTQPGGKKYVERVGSGMGCRWVVARHPQGKPRAALVDEVLSAADG